MARAGQVREAVRTLYLAVLALLHAVLSITFRVDYLGQDSGVFFNVWPEGLGTAAATSERLDQVFR